MIVTVTTIIVLVVGLLSVLLGLYGAVTAVSILEEMDDGMEVTVPAEQKYYLLGLIGVVLLTTRLLVVPVFFWTLQSLVPYCPGAMCAYGVVNVGNPYSSLALILKLTLPFAYGMWLVVELSNRGQPRMPLLRWLVRSSLVVLFPMVLADASADILFIASVAPVYAPCCSSIYDVDPPFSPSAVLGPEWGAVVLVAAIVTAVVLAAFQWVDTLRPSHRLLALVLTSVSGLLYLVALHDTYAPLLLGLPTHHCPYCLFQEYPDTALFSALLWVGVAATGWRVGLESIWLRYGLEVADIDATRSVLRKVASVALIFSMTSMVSHSIVAL